MDYREVLEDLKCIKENGFSLYLDDNETWVKTFEAINLQISKPPRVVIDDRNDTSIEYRCPLCGRILSGRRRPAHCECGQKIDWNGIE